ncbi:hypothetical protein ASG29_08375 [Sphingomonas sp. Leaf412]|uniref:DUF1176 domain-containing protein n=1 Tax=Sphingomonas sp. Leaf412 TaxID=1736370 RepID=UPI0006F3533B|nr:DUF1176 domain-containing protein [Sphingomonas sp. Leaf412]KQT31891.1 hypothetical protein ASG29_08375 [Sphingomonas sp. Leaf412]
MRYAVAATLLLVACAPDPAPPIANDTAANVAAPAVPVAGAPPGPVADTRAAPIPGELKTFRDWTVACDNVARCAMASLGPDMGDFPRFTVQVTRAAGPAGGYEVALNPLSDDDAAPVALTIAGARFDGRSGEGAARLVAAMANAPAMTGVDAAGRALGSVSLAGAAAALRYIDAAQGRAGTVTAAVATGPGAAATVPAAAAVPVIVAPALAGAAARPTAAQLADMRRVARCEDRMTADHWDVRTAALGGGATIVVLPCSAGAYNEIDALFVIRDGTVAPAAVDAPSGFDATGADSQTPVSSIVNGDLGDGLVSSYAKGRGLGDCGVAQTYAWDGRRLRLAEQRAMGECRGNPHYLRTWIARVERR